MGSLRISLASRKEWNKQGVLSVYKCTEAGRRSNCTAIPLFQAYCVHNIYWRKAHKKIGCHINNWMSRNSEAASSQPKLVWQQQSMKSCTLQWRTTAVQVYAEYTELFSLAHGKNIGDKWSSNPSSLPKIGKSYLKTRWWLTTSRDRNKLIQNRKKKCGIKTGYWLTSAW
jgi:hypothetical protein